MCANWTGASLYWMRRLWRVAVGRRVEVGMKRGRRERRAFFESLFWPLLALLSSGGYGLAFMVMLCLRNSGRRVL